MLTASQLIRKACLQYCLDHETDDDDLGNFCGPFETIEQIDAMEREVDDHCCDLLQEAKSELRCGTHETGLRCETSRHYESKTVAMQIDGQWVGWTYWYGGGKFGDPQAIDWIEDAVLLDAVEETRVVLVFSERG